MIQMQTVLEAADNSGAKNLRCIKVLGGSKKRYARVGDIIVASIKDSIPNSRVKAGDVVKAVVALRFFCQGGGGHTTWPQCGDGALEAELSHNMGPMWWWINDQH